MSESFSTLYDPVHGKVDLSDLGGSTFAGLVRKVLSAPMVDRLKRIKQLGAASSSFIAANHSRFAHSLGTMHVARALFQRLVAQECVPIEAFQAEYPEVFDCAESEAIEVLGQYTILAALLQDVGELPFEQATQLVFRPAPNVVELVSTKLDFNVWSWDTKSIFTIALLYEDADAGYLPGVHLPLLFFLIAGKKYPPPEGGQALNLRNQTTAWLHLLDGELDADRLDYVYRDAHHTIGARGTPEAVITTLLRYDGDGPVVSDGGPVADFLATRALLWHRVYLSPSNRFRRLLLALVLREALSEGCPEAREILRDQSLDRSLTLHGFRSLDDVVIEAQLKTIRQREAVFSSFSRRTQRALDLLVGAGEDYRHFWLVPTEAESEPVKISQPSSLPPELFYDTFRELYDHWLYQPGSIRVDMDSLRYLGAPAPIETFGFFGRALEGTWPAAPIAKAVQVFEPPHQAGADWEKYKQALNEGSLYHWLVKADLLSSFELPTDTWDLKDFQGPAIFVSSQWDDMDTVDEVVRVLWSRKRRYKVLRDGRQGLARTALENSRSGVKEAGAVLAVASSAYNRRYQQTPGESYIAIEVHEMMKRVREIPIVFLSLDHYELLDGLPWRSLGWEGGTPILGEPLKGKPKHVIEGTVDAALEVIDEWKPQ